MSVEDDDRFGSASDDPTEWSSNSGWRERAKRAFLSVDGLKYALTLLFLVGAPVYLAVKPEDYTPLVQVLASIFLFLLAYWIGNGRANDETRRQANSRWLPHAEAVTYRLLTLFRNVAMLAIKTRKSCSCACCELPELKDEQMRAVRIRLKTDCEASADRLDDISRQLEDAVGDWTRFISDNCQGDECGRIFNALEERQCSIGHELLKMRDTNHNREGEQGNQDAGCT